MKGSGLLLATLLLVAACASRKDPVRLEPPEPALAVVTTPASPAPAPGPTARDVWSLTLLGVAPLAQRGDFSGADSLLATFANTHPATCETAEASYIRALLRLSPGNSTAKAESALPLIDSYLASTCVAPGRAAEALVVRRVASDMMRQNFVGDSAAADQIRKLKEQLELTKKELDRLKMRVIPPP